MTDKVIQLVQGTPEHHEDVVELFEKLLSDARRGAFDTVFVVVEGKVGAYALHAGKSNLFANVGMLEVLKHNILGASDSE